MKNFLKEYRRKHLLELKEESGEITAEELEELVKLRVYFNNMLHRMRA